MSATSGAMGTPEPTPLGTKIASMSGIVLEKGDTNFSETIEDTGKVHFYLLFKCNN